MTWRWNAKSVRAAAIAAALPVLLLSGTGAYGQREGGRAATAPRASAAQNRPMRVQPALPQRNPGPAEQQLQNRQQVQQQLQIPRQEQLQNRPQTAVHPALNNAGVRAGVGAGVRQNLAPPGHLQDWLNQHRNLPLASQEQMLRSDPNFGRLSAADQQQLVRQLRQVNQMPEEQRERRLERAEVIEHMSPQERMQLNASSRRLATLPADRQTAVKRAFQDLRSVPVDQRPTVLNSARYQGAFTPEERGILTDLLRAEPYEAPR